MSEAYIAYGLLLADARSRGRNGLTLRPAGQTSSGETLYFGVDALGHRHLLVPIAEDYAFKAESGESLELRDWVHPSRGTRFLDLVCTSDGLGATFATLADQVLQGVVERQQDPPTALLQTMANWRSLLRAAHSVSEEAARGLFGELMVLKRLAVHNAAFAILCWRGPAGEVHDFMAAGRHVEVKTSRRDGLDVEISSLGQLDTEVGTDLVLVRVAVDSTPDGQNIAAVVSELEALGCLRVELDRRMRGMGFLLGIDPDEFRFTELGLRSWSVGMDFPGLRSADLPNARRDAIKHVTYELDLVGAPGEMSAEDFEAYCGRMMRA